MPASLRLAATRFATIFFSLLIAFGAVSLPAQAQELSPDHVALARKFIDLSYKITTFEQSLVQAGVDVSDAILKKDPNLREQSNDAIGNAISYFAKQKDEVFNQFARVYALQFTMDELKEMNAFYETPTGQKLAASQSKIDQNIVKLYTLYEDNMRKEMYARVRADLMEQGAKL
jgi:uncharacterized protein